MARLKILWPDGREQEYEITRTITMIGRTKDNDLKITDGGISRKQCKIEGSPGNYSVVDLDSKNGTNVNGIKVATSQLKDGDEIRFGRIIITFLEQETAGQSSSPAPAKPAAAVPVQGQAVICPSCGATIKDGDVLCVKCGTFINKASSFFSSGQGIKDTWISWVILGAVILILVTGGILLLGKNNSDTESLRGNALSSRIESIVRDSRTPTRDRTYGELFDDLNIANSDIDWNIENRGSGFYKVTLTFPGENGNDQKLSFKVDIQSEDAQFLAEESTFGDF